MHFWNISKVYLIIKILPPPVAKTLIPGGGGVHACHGFPDRPIKGEDMFDFWKGGKS